MAKILVVDDHAPNRDLIVALMGYSGHQAIEASDGSIALEQVRTDKPDLVICDILMPTMDGSTVITASHSLIITIRSTWDFRLCG